MQQPARRETVAQAADQRVGKAALGRARPPRVPFRRRPGSSIGDECRLAAHGQPHVALGERRVDRFAQRVDRAPLLVAYRAW